MRLGQHRQLVGLEWPHNDPLDKATAKMHEHQAKRHRKATAGTLIGHLTKVLLQRRRVGQREAGRVGYENPMSQPAIALRQRLGLVRLLRRARQQTLE